MDTGARLPTEYELRLLRQLRANYNTNLKGYLKRTSRQFVADYGWFYEPGPFPQDVACGIENECYNNALRLTLEDKSLIYVEGFAAGASGLGIHHAWATDGAGRVIDNTWREPGVVYAGVPFTTPFVSVTGLRNEGVGSLIDDWQHDWPLLRRLTDQPEYWMEPRGRGVIEIARCRVDEAGAQKPRGEDGF